MQAAGMLLWTFSKAVKQKSSSELLLPAELLWLAAIGALQAASFTCSQAADYFIDGERPLFMFGRDLLHMHGLLCIALCIFPWPRLLPGSKIQLDVLRMCCMPYIMCKLVLNTEFGRTRHLCSQSCLPLR